jgi:FkbM family methyltransferase
LGEIEAALRGHEGVEEAVVVVKGREEEEKRLVAYVVRKRGVSEEFVGKKEYMLPNGMRIAHRNKNETEYLYEEIFEKESYTRNGIEFEEGGCVFDVGANIGMFTLYAREKMNGGKIYAFEPIREIYEALSINVREKGEEVKVYRVGLSNKEGKERFTYYPRYTMMSGKSEYADGRGEVEVIKRYVRNEGEVGRERREVKELEIEVEVRGRRRRMRDEEIERCDGGGRSRENRFAESGRAEGGERGAGGDRGERLGEDQADSDGGA